MARLGSGAGRDGRQGAWLASWVRARGARAAALHAPRGTDELALVASVGLDADARRALALVPRGEGIAGLAFERNAIISTCAYSVRRARRTTPRFKLIDADAMVAVPVQDGHGEIRGVVTVVFPDGKVMDDADLEALSDSAAALPE